MKIKSSEMLKMCLHAIALNKYDYVCAALTGCDYELRMQYKENIVHKADKLWQQYKPSNIRDDMKMTQPWWHKGDVARMETLKKAIAMAESKGD